MATIASGKNPRGRFATLKDHFVKVGDVPNLAGVVLILGQSFGEPDSELYRSGEDAFVRSLAAYSMICYILQLKDRHNGNVLIDNHGRAYGY